MVFVAGEMGGESGSWPACRIAKDGFICDAIVGDRAGMKSSGVDSGGDKSMEISNWFFCSMFSDRSGRLSDPEVLLLMDGVENEGEVIVPPTSELGCEWKGVEGCVVEAVLSAIVRLLVRLPRCFA
jgi:hypothetical protein